MLKAFNWTLFAFISVSLLLAFYPGLSLMMMATASALVVVLYAMVFAEKIPPYVGVLTAWFGYPFRSRGPGFLFKLPGEEITHEVSLTKRSRKFSDEYETKSGKEVGLTAAVEYIPWFAYLREFLSFGDGDIEAACQKVEAAIEERLKSIVVGLMALEVNPDEARKNLKRIAEDAKRIFEEMKTEDGAMKLQEYYGVNLLVISFSSVALSEEKKKALAQLDAQKEENKSRASKIAKERAMAISHVKASQKLYPGHSEKWLSYEEALDRVHTSEGKAPKTIHKLEVDKHTINGVVEGLDKVKGSADGVLKGLAKVLNIFGGKKHGKPKS